MYADHAWVSCQLCCIQASIRRDSKKQISMAGAHGHVGALLQHVVLIRIDIW